jgi:peptide-methionine (S)-S-oxide reductase
MSVTTEKIVFGGGCFWCTEAVFSMFKGVVKTIPGYAGGHTKDPDYENVCAGDTGHAEVLQIEYDPSVVTLDKLLEIFFEMHDPTSVDRQGGDVGSQYRSIILYQTDEQKKNADSFIKSIQKKYDKPIATEIKKLEKFYPAEDYHKDYFKKNPLQPYCIFVVRPKVEKIKKEYDLKG